MREEKTLPCIGLIETRAFIKDENKRYLYCNKAFAGDLGMDPVGIIGKDDFFFYPRYLADKYSFDDCRVLEKRLFFEGQETYFASGVEYWAHTTKVPFARVDGKPAGIFGMIVVAEQCLRQQDEIKMHLDDLKLMITSIFGSDQTLSNMVYKTIHPLADKMSHLHPEDQKDILIHLRDALNSSLFLEN